MSDQHHATAALPSSRLPVTFLTAGLRSHGAGRTRDEDTHHFNLQFWHFSPLHPIVHGNLNSFYIKALGIIYCDSFAFQFDRFLTAYCTFTLLFSWYAHQKKTVSLGYPELGGVLIQIMTYCYNGSSLFGKLQKTLPSKTHIYIALTEMYALCSASFNLLLVIVDI